MENNTVASPKNEDFQDIADIKRKMKFKGTVIKTSLAGALVDIGCDFPGVVHISQLQEQPVNRVEDVVQPGQEVDVWVRRVIPRKKRIELTMIKPLDLDWREIKKDMVLKGKVVRIEKFGAFVEVGAERPGLVHISEITHDYISKTSDVLKEGEEVEVMVLSVNRQKKQIKLSMKALEVPPAVDTYEDIPADQSKKVGSEIKEVKEEIVPTAMEIAMREAMERSNEDISAQPVKSKTTAKGNELEEILSRTLQNRVRTNK